MKTPPKPRRASKWPLVTRLLGLGLELLAMGAVVDPFARRSDPLPCRNRRGLADDGHEFTMSARLRLENAEAVLVVVEGGP